MIIAVKSGIDVRIMVPCKPDHPFVYWATYSYLGEMIEREPDAIPTTMDFSIQNACV